mgnify:CR=1 FL=1
MLLFVQTILLWALISGSVGSFCVFLYFHRDIANMKAAKILTAVTAIISLMLLIVRIIDAGQLPFLNGMDFGFWLNAVMLVMLCFLTFKHRMAILGCVIYPIVAALSIWMTSQNLAQQAEVPALRSYWLDFHVSSAIIAYVAFLLSFVFSVMLLVGMKKTDTKLPSKEVLGEWAYRSVLVGVPFQTIMLITGSVWAEYAWGTFWNWDPKETWALITWFIYAIYLHIRLRGWSEKKLAWLNILGFAAVVFTFFGVSYLLPGLHSYI